jgi:hypothetical protein
LAIKQLQATQTFEPSEPELRAALDKALAKARGLERDANEWLKLLRRSDAFMFDNDRDAWRAAHAAVDANATGALMVDADASPYQQALNEVWEPKFYRENPEQLELERESEGRAALAADAPKQAACAKPPEKRTHKPKGREGKE